MTRVALLLFFVMPVIACSSSDPDVADAQVDADGGAAKDAGADAGVPFDAGGEPDAGGTPDAGEAEGEGSSKGQGGIACASTGSVSTGGVSYSYCVASVAGVELKIVEPTGTADKPLKLAVYLHGDGAGPYNSGLAIKKHAPWTTTQGILYVAARAPNACAWWLEPSYTTCDGETPVPESALDDEGENAQALAEAIDALRAGWDIADSPVLFGGSSGGSIFLAASFYPLFGDRFPGGYALSCGGDAPWAGELAWDGTDPACVGETKLFFTYGDKDFVVPDVLEALSFYEAEGIPTDVKVVPETVAAGTSHCGNVGGSYSYDQIGRVQEVWSGYLGE